jgi:hypothetical protein
MFLQGKKMLLKIERKKVRIFGGIEAFLYFLLGQQTPTFKTGRGLFLESRSAGFKFSSSRGGTICSLESQICMVLMMLSARGMYRFG